MSGDPRVEAKLAKKEGKWQTVQVKVSQAETVGAVSPLRKPGCPLWVAGFCSILFYRVFFGKRPCNWESKILLF